MVHGLKTKNRKSPSVQLDYLINIIEIKPWPPSQSLRSLRSALIQWEHGEKNSGSTKPVAPLLGDGKIEFNESFRLHVNLLREMLIRVGESEVFLKNCIEFNLYEPRRDKTVKGQLLATAVLDFAEYGIVKDGLIISVPMNCKRTFSNTTQPMLFLKIQAVEKSSRVRSLSRDSLVREESMDGNGSESVSASMNDEYGEEADTASITDDDDVSSQSSMAAASSTLWSNGSSNSQKPESYGMQLSPPSNDGINKESKIKVSEKMGSMKAMESNNVGDEQTSITLSNGDLEYKKVKPARSPLDSGNGKKFGEKTKDGFHAQSGGRSLTGKVQQLECKVRDLEGELREAAAIEVGLYSIVAEHGSSVNKVHAPARRLSRLYLHTCKENLQSRRASSARSIVSGLILVAKACGNDVPRLTFWLSNSVVLRVIVENTFEEEARQKYKKNVVKKESLNGLRGISNEWENPRAFTCALEKVESWIFSRIIESVWWQTLTPYMQSAAAKAIVRVVDSECSKSGQKTSSRDQEQANFSLELWKTAFMDACERICPIRAGGHDCGCLPVLSRLVMEQCMARLDVAMFNAILRESADEVPTDPVSDPISDARVLPISPGKASFGAGAQLKNAIGNWSRWLTDLFGIDDDGDDASFKSFHLLNALSDLMMLPKDMLLSNTIRKEVCPAFGAPLIKQILNSFVPDEFCPDPIPQVVLEALDSEDSFEGGEDCVVSLPCAAASVIYYPPSASSIGDGVSQTQLTRSGSIMRKSNTSDDELDELNSPLTTIMAPPPKLSWRSKDVGNHNTIRYQLLKQQVWLNND